MNIDDYFNGKYYDINGIKIANVKGTIYDDGMQHMLPLDSFGQVFGYTNEQVEEMGGEGLYIHPGHDIKDGDVVIDAGGFIGDFSAYAASKGATVYAFEPFEETFKFLDETAKLNKGIFPVKIGLSNRNKPMRFYPDARHPGSDTTSLSRVLRPLIDSGKIRYETMTYFKELFSLNVLKTIVKSKKVEFWKLDNFVDKLNIKRVDFIKADIEGAERFMIEGARETIKKFHPTLSICTYHLNDDPEVLERMIKEIEPKYVVVQYKKKLLAYVP